MARQGRFGSLPGKAPDLTNTIVALIEQYEAARDRNILSAWLNGGKFEGNKVTDSRIRNWFKMRRGEYDKDDPEYDYWDQQLDQIDYQIGESKMLLSYEQGKIGEGGAARWYSSNASRFPKKSEAWREAMRNAARFKKAAAEKARAASTVSDSEKYNNEINRIRNRDIAPAENAMRILDKAYANAGLIPKGATIMQMDMEALAHDEGFRKFMRSEEGSRFADRYRAATGEKFTFQGLKKIIRRARRGAQRQVQVAKRYGYESYIPGFQSDARQWETVNIQLNVHTSDVFDRYNNHARSYYEQFENAKTPAERNALRADYEAYLQKEIRRADKTGDDALVGALRNELLSVQGKPPVANANPLLEGGGSAGGGGADILPLDVNATDKEFYASLQDMSTLERQKAIRERDDAAMKGIDDGTWVYARDTDGDIVPQPRDSLLKGAGGPLEAGFVINFKRENGKLVPVWLATQPARVRDPRTNEIMDVPGARTYRGLDGRWRNHQKGPDGEPVDTSDAVLDAITIRDWDGPGEGATNAKPGFIWNPTMRRMEPVMETDEQGVVTINTMVLDKLEDEAKAKAVAEKTLTQTTGTFGDIVGQQALESEAQSSRTFQPGTIYRDEETGEVISEYEQGQRRKQADLAAKGRVDREGNVMRTKEEIRAAMSDPDAEPPTTEELHSIGIPTIGAMPEGGTTEVDKSGRPVLQPDETGSYDGVQVSTQSIRDILTGNEDRGIYAAQMGGQIMNLLIDPETGDLPENLTLGQVYDIVTEEYGYEVAERTFGPRTKPALAPAGAEVDPQTGAMATVAESPDIKTTFGIPELLEPPVVLTDTGTTTDMSGVFGQYYGPGRVALAKLSPEERQLVINTTAEVNGIDMKDPAQARTVYDEVNMLVASAEFGEDEYNYIYNTGALSGDDRIAAAGQLRAVQDARTDPGIKLGAQFYGPGFISKLKRNGWTDEEIRAEGFEEDLNAYIEQDRESRYGPSPYEKPGDYSFEEAGAVVPDTAETLGTASDVLDTGSRYDPLSSARTNLAVAASSIVNYDPLSSAPTVVRTVAPPSNFAGSSSFRMTTPSLKKKQPVIEPANNYPVGGFRWPWEPGGLFNQQPAAPAVTTPTGAPALPKPYLSRQPAAVAAPKPYDPLSSVTPPPAPKPTAAPKVDNDPYGPSPWTTETGDYSWE